MGVLAPVWISEAGSLGVAPEGKFYRIRLEAEDPDFPGDLTKVTYSLIAGALPSGVQVNTNGLIEGIPTSVADVKGVPTEVAEDITSKFAIRITDDDGNIADRTFEITITGQDKPTWVTPAGSIGSWFDGEELSFQFDAADADPGDELTISLITGLLPAGLSLSSTGLLTGVVTPIPSGSQLFTFTLQLSDGKDVVLQVFEMLIYAQNTLTADSSMLTADTDTITADIIATRPPYIANHVPDLGTFRHDNYFSYKFDGTDLNGDTLQYVLTSGVLPYGLSLDINTGWLSGILPDIALTEQDYTFGVEVYKLLVPTVKSTEYITTMHLIGNIDTEIVWVSDPALGTVDNGAISTLSVEATHATADLFYSLKGGTIIYAPIIPVPDASQGSTFQTAATTLLTADSLETVNVADITADSSITADAANVLVAYEAGPYNKLPQGLALLPSGNIAGRVSFKTFSFDSCTTTFDSEFDTSLNVDPTTFDLTYRFTVEAHSPAVEPYLISVTREFTIIVNAESCSPHNELYCRALPPREDRLFLETFLADETIIPTETLYRSDDPYFASAGEVIYTHAYGLTPSLITNYVAALELNHYNKNLVLGEIKTARALDENENVVYEVVYSQIVDTYVNAAGISPPLAIDINYPAIDDGTLVTTVYPNSLANMRTRVIDEIGQTSKLLPRWMLSKQEDGNILGFTPAWIIAYAQPGQASLLQYKIQESIGTKLNLIDFEIDRYTIDSSLSLNWQYFTADMDEITADNTVQLNAPGRWLPGIQTTFDRTQSTADDTLLTADDDRYTADEFIFTVINETIFDGGSCRFVSPSDTLLDNSDLGDRYVMFPKKTIVNNKQ